MATTALVSLLEAFGQMTDPRDRRGVRHPFAGMVALVFLALLSRVSEFAAIVRWARRHWDTLREPLGFTRDVPPCDTTLERALAGFTLAEFQQAFSRWLDQILTGSVELVIAVDGKTCKQGHSADGRPVQMLNVFAHDLQVCLGSWALEGDKSTEPVMLKAHLHELFAKHPALWLITGDALYCQRNLAEILVESEHDYLFQLKGNQPEMLEAAEACLGDAEQRVPDAQTTEKRGAPSNVVVFGSTWITPHGPVIDWALPVAACSCASTARSAPRRESKRPTVATSSRASRRRKLAR